MFRTKESKVAAVILLTFALLLIAGVFPKYVLFSAVATVLVFAGAWIYAALTKKQYGEQQDERSERCSLMATHNAFMSMLLLTAFVTVAVQAGWLKDAIVGLQSIWLLGMTAYFLSYLVYKRAV
jgi:hypothetical protein